MSFVCVDALILALVFSDVGRVEKVGEQNKVRKVHQHAEDDVFLCLSHQCIVMSELGGQKRLLHTPLRLDSLLNLSC